MIAVIGDIHGCFNTFLALLSYVEREYPQAKIVVAGDLIDRGPDSRKVVNYIRSNRILAVKGNHEAKLKSYLVGENPFYETFGGKKTLANYGPNERHILESDSRWLNDLPAYLEFDETVNGRKVVVSHATISRVWDRRHIKEAFEDGALWDRHDPVDVPGIYNVFGHTPIAVPEIKDFYANIDTGCYFDRQGKGHLTALIIEDGVVAVFSLKKSENE